MTDLPATWPAEVLRFWFEETKPEQHFKKDEAFDNWLRERFLPLHEQVAVLPVQACLADKELALAAVIVCDQFPRNMFRGSPRAFATDGKALAIAEAAIARGYDRTLSKAQRTFLYLPFEHAEDVASQARGVELIALLDDADLSKWAVAHKAIIDRFGRFPHRNAALGRQSTPEEVAFLEEPNSSF